MADALAQTDPLNTQPPPAQAAPGQLLVGGPYPQFFNADGQEIPFDSDEAKAAREEGGFVDPLVDLTAEDLAALATESKGEFSLRQLYQERAEHLQKPELRQKLADAFVKHADATPLVPIPKTWEEAGKAVGGLWDMAKGYVKTLAVGAPALAVANLPFPEDWRNTARLLEAEIISGNRAALQGLANTATHAGDKLARATGLAPKLTELDAQGRMLFFERAMAEQQQLEDISAGKDQGFLSIPKEELERLSKAGFELRPEEVAQYSAGSPMALELFGQAFGAAGKAASAAKMAVAPGAGEVLSTLVTKGGGKAISGTAATVEGAAKAAAMVAPAAGAVSGASGIGGLGGAGAGVVGAGLGWKAGKEAAKTLREKVVPAAQKVRQFGRDVASTAPATSASVQLTRDLLGAAPGAAGELGKGLAFDATLSAAAETPEEQMPLGPGMLFAIPAAGIRVGLRTVSGQLIAPRAWDPGAQRHIPSNGYFPGLDAVHAAETANLTPGERARVNAMRAFVRMFDPEAEVMFVGESQEPFLAALQEAGAGQNILTGAKDARGLFTSKLTDANGKERRLITFRDLDAAPHEVKHAMDDVLGNATAAKRWAKMREFFTPEEWENFAQNYAQSLGWDGTGDWQTYLARKSGWANAEAAEALVMRNRGEQQGPPSPEEVRNALAEVQNTGAENILGPEGVRQVGEAYAGAEASAETWKALFNNTGPTMAAPKGAIRWTANLLGSVLSALGIDPLSGRFADYGLPLRSGAVEQVRGETVSQLGQKLPSRPTITPRVPAGQTAPKTQEQKDRESDQRIATSAPDVILEGADQSQREMAGTLAEASATGQGVRVIYRSAPAGQEGGAGPASAAAVGGITKAVTRPVRREIINRFRNMPEEAREMISKVFVPFKLRTSRKGLQAGGWAPEVFAANAQKLAEFLTSNPDFHPELFGADGPYAIDAAKKSFTVDGWRNLLDDAAVFSKNQQAGLTGAGEKLVVPKTPGYYEPPVDAGARVEQLPQERADVINRLFGFKRQSTGIVASETKIPLNLMGQEVSRATKPGRVVEVGGPEFGGELVGPKSKARAEKLGIVGERVRETNPFAAELEARQNAPSFIEVFQWLNLEHMKSVELAPEQPQIRGNTLTLAAGFKAASREQEGPWARLFSGRGGTGGAGQSGSWWTRNAKRAASFGPELSTVSVPESIAKAGEAEARRLGSGTAGDVVLPDEWVRRAQELGVVDQPTYAIAEGMSAQFKTREKEPPKKTQIAYKLFRVKKSEPGVLYPLFVDAKQPVEIGKWLDAEDTQSVVAKDGRKRVIAHKIGKKTELADGTFVNTLAYRPGWHSGDIPYASHIGKKDKATGKIVARKADEVWAEVEVSADRDFQPDANANGQREGKFVAGDADLDFIPEDGFYRYKTNPNMTGDWIISGAIKVKRVLGEAEVNKLLTDAGVEPMPWDKGPLDLKKLGFDETPPALADEQAWLDSIDYSKYEAKSAAEPQTPEAMFEARRKSKKIVQEALPHAAAGEEINVVHLSDTPGLTEIDPAKMGSAKATPRDMRGTPKSFWFVEKSPLGQDVNEFGKAGKQAYGTTLRGERIYDLRGDKNDVLGYFSEPNREAADRNLIDKGYAGVITDTPDGRQVVMLFKRAKVAPLKPTKAATTAPKGVLHSEMVQFAAPDDPNPRKIRAAIVWDPKTGKHWEGPMHFVAMQRAAMDGIPPTELMGLTQGFIDGLGAKLTREEAFIRAQELEQLKPVDVRMEAGEVSKSDKRLVSEETQFKPRDLVTPEREEQFKESKVRFADGTLKPVFHGTTTEPEKVTGFSTIGFNAHFGGPGQAATRTVGPWETRSAKAKESMATARTVPVFLDIKNPLRVSQDPADWTNPTSVAASLRKAGVKSENLRTDYVNRRVDSEVSDLMDAGYDEQTANALANQAVVEELKQVLVEKGYDGIDYNNQFESETPLLLTRPKQLSAMEEGRFPSYLDEGQKMKYEGRKDYDDGSSYIPFYPEQIRHALTGEQAVQFKSAELKDFSDETKLSDALKSSDWAILTWNREDLGAATDAKNIAANEKLSRMLQAAGLEFLEVEGEYKGIDQGKNFLVVGITPKEALSLGKFGKQESVIVADGLLYMDGKIQPTDHSKNVIGDEAVKTGVWSRVKGGPAFSLGIAEAKQDYTLPTPEPYPTQHTLPPSKPLLTSKEIEAMTTEQAREHFPEGVFPDRVKNRAGKMVDPQVTSNHKKSPLFRRAKNEAEAVELYADELVKEHEQWKNHPDYQSGLKWYSEFTPKMTAHFGKHSQIFAELLSATSPNNQPKPNFFYAVDALSMYKAGRYDAMLKKFQEGIELLEKNRDEAMAYTEKRYNETGRKIPKAGLAEENFILQWIQDHNLIPRQSNGQRFGMHSIAVLKVLARRWLTDNSGPKTLNFIKNLVGTGNEATVDVWADRTLRRIGYRERKRWRITPRNSTGIPDVDFFFGQKVFRRAAEKIGIEPSALQGGLWFSEKRLWADQGWGRLDLGDYRTEMRNIADIQAKVDKRMSPPQQSLNLVSPRPTP